MPSDRAPRTGSGPWPALLLAVSAFCGLPAQAANLRAAKQDVAGQSDTILVPRIVEPWIQIAGDPDLGDYTTKEQQPVDFGIWQAADGTWQLWSCIRKTACGGNTRLFHCWEGKSLATPNWTPRGIAMQAEPELGETAGGLQAPHVIQHEGKYWMFYGDWRHICLAASDDGKQFQRVLQAGRPQLFSEDTDEVYANTRDPMILRHDGLFYCYYTAYPHQKGAVYCRTSKDLLHWSESTIVHSGGWAGGGPFSAECPHVVYHQPSGYFYLFRTHRYGQNAVSSVYRSRDPLDFGPGTDDHLVTKLPVAAPEIIRHRGHWYIASLLPSLKGVRLARLNWEALPD